MVYELEISQLLTRSNFLPETSHNVEWSIFTASKGDYLDAKKTLIIFKSMHLWFGS